MSRADSFVGFLGGGRFGFETPSFKIGFAESLQDVVRNIF